MSGLIFCNNSYNLLASPSSSSSIYLRGSSIEFYSLPNAPGKSSAYRSLPKQPLKGRP